MTEEYSIESIYATSMVIMFSAVYITIFILTVTLLYDAYIQFFMYETGTDMGFFTGILGLILLFGTIWAFVPRKSRGIELKKKDCPELFKLIDKAVKNAEMDPLDKILLVEGSGISVKGFFSKQLQIGVASLRHITVKDFECILYHELGHFAAEDTKMGAVLGLYYDTLEKQRIASINFWNYSPHIALAIIALPGMIVSWLLMNLFSILFAPYSKYREYAADEFAASFTSSQKFANALTNYATYSHAHDTVVPQIIVRYLANGEKLKNVYITMTQFWNKKDHDKLKRDLLKLDESFFSSHPSLKNRISALGVKKTSTNPGKKLKQLFPKFTYFEEELSDDYTIKVGISAGMLKRGTESL